MANREIVAVVVVVLQNVDDACVTVMGIRVGSVFACLRHTSAGLMHTIFLHAASMS